MTARMGSRTVPIPRPAPKPTTQSWRGVSERYYLDDGAGDLSWQADAACRFHEPELFFSVGTTGPSVEQDEQAKAVCRTCPSVVPCALWALDALEFGVAGGMTAEERREGKRSGRLRGLAS